MGISHQRIDERSLAFGKAIAAKLSAQPKLIQLARETLLRWQTTCSPDVQSTLGEWLTIVEGPIEGIVRVLTSGDERSVRLRQSNPFTRALSAEERNAIIRQFHSDETARA